MNRSTFVVIAVVSVCLPACHNGFEPTTLARVWVAESIGGAPLPYETAVIGGTSFVYQADTLMLSEDSFDQRHVNATRSEPGAALVPRSSRTVGYFSVGGGQVRFRDYCVGVSEGVGQCLKEPRSWTGTFLDESHFTAGDHPENRVVYRAVMP